MKRTVVKREARAKPPQKSSPSVPAPVAPPQGSGWISFSYSHSEMTSVGDRTRVRSREYRFENGKLEAESFDGTLDGAAYREAVGQAQKLVAAQLSAILGFFSAFLPSGPGKK